MPQKKTTHVPILTISRKPAKIPTSIRFWEDQIPRLREIAITEGRDETSMVRDALDMMIQAHERGLVRRPMETVAEKS